MPPRKSNERTLKQLRALAQSVVDSARQGQAPAFKVPSRTTSNTVWNPKKGIIQMGAATAQRELFNLSMARKFMQTLLVAAGCRELLELDSTTSIRDLFYICLHTIPGTDEKTFDGQEESDPVIEDLEVMLGSLREELHLFAEKKGALAGLLTVEDRGDTIDCRRMGSGGWAIPSIVEADTIRFGTCEAKFVLLVEKGAVWNRLNEDKFWRTHPAVLVHGGGMPPRGVRRLLYRLHHELKLPVLVLVDNDPWGFYIYSVVKQGSINLAFESERMAIPKARFLGLSSFDRERYQLPPSVCIKLDDRDVRRAKQIMQYPWFEGRKQFQREMQHMLKSGVKLEIEALSNKGLKFISETYLPERLKDGGIA